jgi:retron-type reverse transcriptase
MLHGIYEKNLHFSVDDMEPPVHTNIMDLVSQKAILVTAYKFIRPNKGASSLAWAYLSKDRYNRLNNEQKEYLKKTLRKSPDGISNKIINATCYLLKKGEYPWGTSKRIYIPKPGDKTKKRPITIPPFMDRVVQTAIKMILEAIYEPWFEKMNRSVGFRPGKSCHHAITAIKSSYTMGFRTAIEGDVVGAYDRVHKEKRL